MSSRRRRRPARTLGGGRRNPGGRSAARGRGGPRLPARAGRLWWRQVRRGPSTIRLVLLLLAAAVMAAGVNLVYQVMRKPTELFYPVSSALMKAPQQTWSQYGGLFRRYATATVSAEFLAALAQVEGSGNPLVRTYWRWSWVTRPFEIYRPASSAVGMYQMTDGTFAEARHYCIREHRALREEAGGEHGCGFIRPYLRILPADEVELTSAYLDVQVTQTLARSGLRHLSLVQRQRLAAVIHLCGSGAAAVYARHGLRFGPGARCGDHDPRDYVARVEAMRGVFRRLAAQELIGAGEPLQ